MVSKRSLDRNVNLNIFQKNVDNFCISTNFELMHVEGAFRGENS